MLFMGFSIKGKNAILFIVDETAINTKKTNISSKKC